MSGFKINENFEGLDKISADFEQKNVTSGDIQPTENIDTAESAKVFVSADSEYGDTKKKKKKKTSNTKKWIMNIIIIVLVAIIAVSLYNVGDYYIDIYHNESEIEEIKDVVHYGDSDQQGDVTNDSNTSSSDSTGGGGGGNRKPKEVPTYVDIAKLKEKNSDAVGWIYSQNGTIDYPIVQTTNNDYYLNRSFYKKKNSNGSIFMDYRSRSDFSLPVTVIYGHSMDSGAMFKTLLNYKKQSYYKKYPNIYIFNAEGKFRVDIFAAYETNSKDMVYGLIRGENAVNRFIEHANSKSKIKTDVTASSGDKLVALSTCSYSSKDSKFIVVGKLVKVENEDTVINEET